MLWFACVAFWVIFALVLWFGYVRGKYYPDSRYVPKTRWNETYYKPLADPILME